ncbi:MAG TPA: c-type cytochrome [bacterium]|nr:c-type cytochrome [bacterium]
MKRARVVSGMVLALVLGSVVILGQQNLWSQDNAAAKGFGKNLQVLKFNNMIELQSYMKGLTESLGVDCKYCHDLTAFEKDIDDLHKDEARAMMKMTQAINEQFFKDNDKQVNCFVCHRGRTEPVFSLKDWKQILENEKK